MSSCIFTKRGLKVIRYNCDTEKEEITCKDEPACHINHYCEIEEGVTLKQIMNVVANSEALSAIISVYSDINNIKGWHEELNRKTKRDTDLAYIEIFRSGQIWKKDIQIWLEWLGVRKRASKTEGKKVSLSYAELCNIAHVPVKLNTKFKIWEPDQKKEDKPIIDYISDFTMLEILHPIYFDIGFHGGPKDRDAIKKDMCKTVDEVLSHEIETFNMDKL
jgi:hypothetical protein